jgi:hypothetical protein
LTLDTQHPPAAPAAIYAAITIGNHSGPRSRVG